MVITQCIKCDLVLYPLRSLRINLATEKEVYICRENYLFQFLPGPVF